MATRRQPLNQSISEDNFVGLSQRQFARAEGCARSLVQRKIQSGHLQVLPNGTIDPALVGTPWRRGNEPRQTPLPDVEGIPARWESEARKAYFDALLKRLEWERAVEQVVLIEDVATVVTDQFARVRSRIRQLGDTAEKLAKASSAPEAQGILAAGVNTCLADLSADGYARVVVENLPDSLRQRFIGAQ